MKKADRVLDFLVAAALIFFVVRLLDALIFDVFVTRRRNVAAPQLLRQIIALALYFFIFAGAVKVFFDVEVTGWLTGGAVVAAVIGLALQETLGNLFAGIALHMEGAFEVGDVVHSGDFLGVVESVSWRATRVRGFNNQTIVLPNSVVARERVEVFPRNNLNARILQVGIDYHVPPATAINVLTQAASHVEGVAHEAPCFARVGAFADSALIYEVKYFTRDYSARDRIDADIRKAIWYAMRRNNIAVPFPIRSFAPYTPPEAHHGIDETDVLQRLEQVDVLSPLSDEARRELAVATEVHHYSKGEAILRHGTAGDSMFVVHAGTVSVRVPKLSETGGHEVTQLAPGSVFGEMALLTGEVRTADVVAVSDVVALEIRKDSLQPILKSHPELAEAITAKVMQRQGHLDSLRNDAADEQQSVLSRIRAYFGL
jgi:small-conductance mechanosensitive channel/CRP-like cAMP-binding protein